MAIYISKNAVNNIPDEARSKYSPVNGGALVSKHFKNSSLYTSLTYQGQGADFVEEGSKGSHINLLQVAINAVSQKRRVNQNILVDGIFGPKTKKAVMNIQESLGIENTGIINSETLLAIDKEMASNILYDAESGEVLNKNNAKLEIVTNTTGSIIQTYLKADDQSKLGPKIEEGEVFYYLQSTHEDYGIVTIDNNLVINREINLEDSTLSEQNKFFVKKEDVTFSTTVEQPEPGAELITVQPGESLISIIYNKYYGEEYHILKNPNVEDPNDPRNDLSNPDNVIHTFPQRNIQTDARLKFIVNLLLYMNSDEDQNIHNIELSAPYKRYTDEDIDELNIYDNEGYNLNYQLYLEKLQAKDPEYQWEFKNETYEVEGRSYSFDAPIENIEGKQLWLPSRTYVEGLYYALNIQPKVGRMYKKVTIPNSITPEKPEGDSFLDWVEENVFEEFINIVRETLDTVEDLAEEVVETVITTYREAREYFSKMYDWFIASMNDFWERGFGAQLDTGLVITAPVFGVPGTLRKYETSHLWRNVTPEDKFVMTLFEKSTIEVGIDVGIGPELVIGAKKKKGVSKVGSGKTKGSKRKTKYGITAIGAAEGVLAFETRSKYEFDISKGNTPLIAMGIAMLNNSSIVDNLTQNPLGKVIEKGIFILIDYFLSANIDPEEYLVQWDAGVYLQGKVYGEAFVELGDDKNEKFSNNKGEKNNNLKPGGILALLDKLDFSADAEGFRKYGGKFTYKAEFENLPDVYEEGFRMPSKVSLEGELYAESGQSLEISFGSFIAQFITGLAEEVIPLTPTFNLHLGMALLLNLEYTRKTTPDQHNFLNHFPVANALYGVFDPENNITKTVGLKLYSGSLDDPLSIGTESIFWFDFTKLKEYIITVLFDDVDNDASYWDVFENFIDLFHNISLRKKIVIGDGITNKNSKKARNIVTKSGTKLQKKYKNFFDIDGDDFFKDLFKNFLSFSTAIDIGANLELKEIIQTAQFVYRYLQFVASKSQFVGEDIIKYERVEKEMSKIVKEATQDIIALTIEDSVNSSILTDIYTRALINLEDLYNKEELSFLNQNLRSYINIIGDFIKILDQEGILSGTVASSSEVIKTISPHLKEIYLIMESAILFLLKKSNLNFYLEGNLTGSFSGRGSLGAITKAKLGFSLEAGIYNRTDLIKDGKPVIELTDSYFDFINDILSIFGNPSIEELANSYKIGVLLTSNSANKNTNN
ncbi:peptidoglycan-binding domain-containing protein [uncultured Dokdonia sp.]|uniref:peptidoglycan-binding domain-containing protein n=1 Tax=uncultured Dokdonia sp. TaxID=575653 RepID=UPI002637CD6E|nr:peptidoglycan-binding domain-containing protein [uncultured Dokdonia sp.]